MATSGKGKGAVPTVQWWKHLRDWKRPQNRRVRNNGKALIEQFWADEHDDPDYALVEYSDWDIPEATPSQ